MRGNDGAMGTDSTYDEFVAARRNVLIAELGDGPDAEAAVDRALKRCRRGWARLERDTDVEASVRELAAHELERPRRRRLTAYALATLAVLVGGGVVVANQPAPPPVRLEANVVPAPWYGGDDLHLADVVVTLPGVQRFVSRGDAVVVENADGSRSLVDSNGDVSDFSAAMPRVQVVEPIAQATAEFGQRARMLEVVVGPEGDVVHLAELLATKPGAGTFVRQSETGQRVLLVCPDEPCSWLRREVVREPDVRLH